MSRIDEIKSAILDREEELRQKFEKESLIERKGFQQASKLLSTDTILIITGVRRCGKSILAFSLGKNQKYAYINFEDERLRLPSSELNIVLEAAYALKGDIEVFIFDEIQNIEGWEQFVSRQISNKKIVITGSNARLLSKELATFLTGRHIDLTLFPFSFQEYLLFHQYTPNMHLTKEIAKIKHFLDKYIAEGGFPLRYKVGKIFLLELFKDILERDIIQRYSIKHVQAFKDVAKYLLTQASREMSYNQLKNIVNIKSVHTIKNYVSYLQNAYLLFVLERFSFKLKKQILAPKKVYAIDTGLADAVGFTIPGNYGRIMENTVALELFRKREQTRDHEVYYWKDHQQREVDFVLHKDKKITQLIQVCYDLSSLGTKEREITSLLRASTELRCNNLLVITMDYEHQEIIKKKKIKYVPLWKWLLTSE